MKKKKDNSNKFLCLFIVIIAFTLAFALLISKQDGNTELLADVKNNNFNVVPEVGKTIVARDMTAIYPKFYVAYINDSVYSIYEYNYYETTSQYNLEYNRLIDSIVDYNIKDKMIRTFNSRGYGTYDGVLNNLSTLVNCSDLKIY